MSSRFSSNPLIRALVFGNIGKDQDEAQIEQWAHNYGCTVHNCEGLTIILMPATAKYEEDSQRSWERYLTFYGPDGNDSEFYLQVEENRDALQTTVSLVRYQDYEQDAHLARVPDALSLEDALQLVLAHYPEPIQDYTFSAIQYTRTFRLMKADHRDYSFPTPERMGRFVLAEQRHYWNTRLPQEDNWYFHWELGLFNLPAEVEA